MRCRPGDWPRCWPGWTRGARRAIRLPGAVVNAEARTRGVERPWELTPGVKEVTRPGRTYYEAIASESRAGATTNCGRTHVFKMGLKRTSRSDSAHAFSLRLVVRAENHRPFMLSLLIRVITSFGSGLEHHLSGPRAKSRPPCSSYRPLAEPILTGRALNTWRPGGAARLISLAAGHAKPDVVTGEARVARKR